MVVVILFPVATLILFVYFWLMGNAEFSTKVIYTLLAVLFLAGSWLTELSVLFLFALFVLDVMVWFSTFGRFQR